jgi:RHS repeat-associated protein
MQPDDETTTPDDRSETFGAAPRRPRSLFDVISERYDIVKELGAGGMGVVLHVFDRLTEEDAALKLIRPELARRRELVDRFKREVRLARQITHKRVCRTYELLPFADTLAISMEYVDGDTLRELLRRLGGLGWRTVIRIAEEICSALEEAHLHGIVHRDLKPENVMLDREGHVKVMDFGIAHSPVFADTAPGAVIGTPSYMAPEQASSGSQIDARTDIYLFGLLLYEMYTGSAAGQDLQPGRYGSGATAWTHDAMGRILKEQRIINGTSASNKAAQYSYYPDGELYKLTYPSGRIVTYTPDSAGRSVSAVDSVNSINYVTNATYAPHGALASLSNGTSILGSFTYNIRLQPLQIFYGTNTPPSLAGSTCPTTVGNIMHRVYNFGPGTNDNGNVQSIANCRDTNRTQNFDYDSLNRIAHAYTSGTNWGETFTIDPWGNLTNIGSYSGKTNQENLNAAPASVKNQLNGFCHDAAGNLVLNSACPTGTFTPTYSFDIENRLAATGTYSYVYDGDGQRMKKCSNSGCTVGTLYWRSTAGDPILEAGVSGSGTEEYVFFNGKRVARRDITGSVVHYYFADHLGSASVVTNATGTTPFDEDLDYYPFGGIVATSSDVVPQHYKFTGKERDAESGLDNFGARYNASSMGRFMTPDPLWVKLDRLIDPQRLNLYAYGRNNPLRFTDPTGMDVVLGKCSGGDAKKCFNTALEGLQKEDRSHVHLVEGDGKNGFAKGQFGVAVDADYKSSSKNFSLLQNLANDHSGVASLNVVGPKDTFSSNVGVQQGPKVVIQSFKSIYGVDNYVSSRDAVPGQTLFPLIGSPLANTIYGTGKNTEVYVANDQSDVEIVKTMYHEMTHVFLGDFGRAVPNSLEDAPGVKPQLNRAEQEAEQNSKQ